MCCISKLKKLTLIVYFPLINIIVKEKARSNSHETVLENGWFILYTFMRLFQKLWWSNIADLDILRIIILHVYYIFIIVYINPYPCLNVPFSMR